MRFYSILLVLSIMPVRLCAQRGTITAVPVVRAGELAVQQNAVNFFTVKELLGADSLRIICSSDSADDFRIKDFQVVTIVGSKTSTIKITGSDYTMAKPLIGKLVSGDVLVIKNIHVRKSTGIVVTLPAIRIAIP